VWRSAAEKEDEGFCEKRKGGVKGTEWVCLMGMFFGLQGKQDPEFLGRSYALMMDGAADDVKARCSRATKQPSTVIIIHHTHTLKLPTPLSFPSLKWILIIIFYFFP
jgi:hypothetical protein